jgi:hypothetical protein
MTGCDRANSPGCTCPGVLTQPIGMTPRVIVSTSILVNKSGVHRHRLSIRFGKTVAALSSGSRSMSIEPVATVCADRMSH